jgi:hypothetical protein
MKSPTLLLLFVLLVSQFVSAEEIYNGTCEINFSGTSSIRNFSGHVTSNPFQVTVDKKNNQTTASWVTNVSVKKMKTSNSVQDNTMYKMFDNLNSPLVKGKFENINLSQLSKQKQKTNTVPFTLTIRKKNKTINATLSDLKISGSKISFTLDYPVSLSDFKLKPPSLFGMVKVGDEVTVKNRFKFTRT